MHYSIEEIARIAHAVRNGDTPADIEWLLTDSRSLSFPEESLFFALASSRNDGHRYLPQLYARGVRNFVVSRLPHPIDNYRQANFLVVDDPLAALQQIAVHHRSRLHIPVVGITGSNGKTIIKEWLYQLLSPCRRVTRSPRSYNSQVGVPLSVWLVDGQSETAILEAGISQPGEMERLEPMVRPTVGILSNIGEAHQENFASMEQKCDEKLKLFAHSDSLVYNADDPLIAAAIERAGFAGERIGWSRKKSDAPLFVEWVKRGASATFIGYRHHGTQGQLLIPFADDASIENAIHCTAAALALGLDPEQIAERMEQLEPVAMRLEVKEGKRGCILINDSYNSDPNSLDIAIDFMARRAQADGTRGMTLILSDLQQTGQPAAALYRHVAEALRSRGVGHLLGVGSEISSAAPLFKGMESRFFGSTDELIASGEAERLQGQVVLIKGARSFEFDRITELLEQKVHETILEINLSAIRANLNRYRSLLHPHTKMVCMVKASAYGAGSIEVAKTLQECNVDYLAVAVADEGADLRRAGITTNIMIMNPELTAFKTMFDHRLEPEVYSFSLLEALIRSAEREGVSGFPIHLKLDTGMSRLGFLPHEVPQLVERLQRQKALVPRSVFSHFVGSDSPAFDDFSRTQIARYEQGSSLIRAAFPHTLRHLCNSAGIERFGQVQYEMVRLGLGLYGVNPIDNSTLQNVSTLKSVILQIHDVPAGETVGYSRRGQLSRPSRIAALPIGYADGLNRRLGNRNAYCMVNGQRAEYVGNICMDVCMVDVTDIECREGDSVEIFGPQLPVSTLSDTLGTIPYEILTGVSTRVKRVYIAD